MEIDGYFVRQTEKALCLNIYGDQHWFPFSQIEVDRAELQDGYAVTIEVPMWLAKEKGLV